jgi:hypothetical protein
MTIRVLNSDKKYNQQAIDSLRILLAQAETGEIKEFMAVSKLASGEYEHCWTGCENLYELAGQLERMKYLTMERMNVG